MKNILFICTEGFDTPGPSNHLISSLIEDMLENNFKVTLIQSRRTQINDDLPDTLKNQEHLSVNIVDRKIIEKSSFVRRYLEESSYAFRCFKIWKQMKDVDAVFVQSCPTVIFSILLLRIFLKKPILYSVQDMWPGSAVNSGVLSNKFIASIFYKIQKLAYKNSNVLTVISEDMKTKVVEQGVPNDKIYPIVNWFDDRSVKEVSWEDNRFVQKYNLSRDKFYVQYAGTMGYVFDYKMVLDVAELLKEYKDIQFQMIGQGSQKDAFVKEKEKRGLENIIFYPLEPQGMVSDVYSTCTICLIPLKKGIIGNSVPSKAGLLMACNRAIVNSVDEESDYYRMFNENEMGISAPNDNPRAVADAILDLYNHKEKRDSIAKNGHDFGKKYYSRSVNTKKFIELFETMVRVEGNK
ncbi:glycosyltransferase family 4 protein [Neobacillus massiliamazoniensis]|uniref:Group 1 glycosyl transferase n=1 Tax=Neobacillus massiliamazoniensis TaxID=1499688 RepID=A0A0U1NQ50_9BACI|nr:glycosyltransferase family 4 protein [Neobacillus massiliamazoniensis]CRK80171.1 group 1 glycosyl transferase [Neobacillus massiliamazoniensis]